MYTLLAAAAMAACIGGAGQPDCQTRVICHRGFAPSIHNGLLVTAPPEDQTRVYTAGHSTVRGRLWVGDDVKDIHARRAWRENPGRLAYGAEGACDERVHLRVYNQYVSISPWQRVEGEGWSNFEAARQQWLAERGYTGGVRTFVNPSRLRSMRAECGACCDAPAADESEKSGAAEGGLPEPSATIRLRKPNETGGVIKKVDAGVAGGVRIVSGIEPVRVSFPMTIRTETVQRAAARGWTGSSETRTAAAEE